MSGARFLPRNLAFADLIRVLVSEHETMRQGLGRARKASDMGDFEGVSRELSLLDPVFRQHIADEEAQILRLLIGELGVEGAKDEITVFQQHRPIYQMMKAISELASKKATDLRDDQAKLTALFEDHARAEEQRVFPKALTLPSKRPSDA